MNATVELLSNIQLYGNNNGYFSRATLIMRWLYYGGDHIVDRFDLRYRY